MLDYAIDLPPGPRDGLPLIVLLHGRGSDERDLMGARSGLPPDAIVVTPRAPHAGTQWGYGGGWAWYRFLGGTAPEPQSFATSQLALTEFLEQLPAMLPVNSGPVILGGFSQGGTTALGYALSHPGTVDGLLMFSGFVPDHPSVRVTPETVAGTEFFWGHGVMDQMIPFERAVTGRAALAAAGARLEARDYRAGHWIEPEELADASRWLARFEVTPGESTR